MIEAPDLDEAVLLRAVEAPDGVRVGPVLVPVVDVVDVEGVRRVVFMVLG